ncbi:MAG: GDSL-type esterase/lipase family protein [Muribaculaceae bacterium]|nr:GDSL-type esterase/lipase family protein [Muribaculaceae bacterium]
MLQGLLALDKNVVPPCSNKIAYTGRINKSNGLSYLFVYPGTSYKASFTGSGIDMMMKPGSGYFEVVVDGVNPHKIFIDENDSIVTLASNLGQGIHEVEVTLVYEGYAKRPEFKGFRLHEGAEMLAAPQLPDLKLEFIGNSITCGYGNEAPDKSCPFADSTENHYFTYAALTARALNAQEVAVARSGIGVYRNYAGKDVPNTMTKWYDYTCILDSTQKWDFKQYRPDVILVNLGTNDLSTKGYDINTYEEYYLAFIRHLHEVQPKAKIVALTGSMLGGQPLKEQKVVLDRVGEIVNAEGIEYYRFDMSTQDGSLGYGASWHPSLKQHEKMAAELIPFLREILMRQHR